MKGAKWYEKHPEELEEDLAGWHGMLGHPKRYQLYALAYEYGHAGGYDDILYWYSDLVELVK